MLGKTDSDFRRTQRSRILRLLVDARGSWVDLTTILNLGIAQYNARVFELRRLGFRIENRKERRCGKLLSSFRLTGPAVAQRVQESEQKGEPSAAAPLSLFGDLSPTHKDLG